MNEERNAELIFRQKELNQRLKDVAIGPLNYLENEMRLADKYADVKINPEQIYLTQDQEKQFQYFLQRDENCLFLKNYENDIHKAEALLKYEFSIL